MQIKPDDEVYRVDAVWLGPKGLTFPWSARYLSYATWLGSLGAILTVEAVTPLTVGIPPVWEMCLATFATYALMGLVDHERPISSLARILLNELSAPRRERPSTSTTTIRKY